ncbi:unnamed protein product [Orchesella dallaii]|uniref:Uncharacterized protein n=1 Tax=Orchesella dallaii TaxID=48710 RepID=A0ABP1QRB4_9HEXA
MRMSMLRKDGTSWNRNSGRNLRYFSDLPPVEEDEHRNTNYDGVPIYAQDEDADATYRSQRPRSPIQKITRGFVEEDKPTTRNFGDYDPVRGQPTISSSLRIRRFEPAKLESRKVVYLGIPDKRSSQSISCRINEFEGEESEGEDFGYNDPVCMDSKNQPGQIESSERFKFSEYHGNEGPATFVSTIRGKSQGNQNQELSHHLSYSKQAPNQPYSVSTFSRRTVNSESQTGYPYTNKNLEPLSQLDRGSYLSFMQKATPTQPQSSWMAYTQGTGFYQQPGSTSADTNRGHLLASNASEHADKIACNRAEDQGLSTESKPTFKYGYFTGKEPLSRAEECAQAGRHEALFCEKAIPRNLFYRLKRLPDYEVYGTTYYSYEIEFWPFRNHSLKETVTGHQMADKLAAKDSVFAAALKKLDTLMQETTPYTPGHLMKSETRPLLKSVSETEPNRKLMVSQELDRMGMGSQVPSRTRIVFQEESSTAGGPHVPDLVRAVLQKAGPTRAVFRETGSTRTVLHRPDRTSQLAKDLGPFPERKLLDLKTPNEKEGSGFRIAIPRGPSIIWDGSRPRPRSQRNRK